MPIELKSAPDKKPAPPADGGGDALYLLDGHSLTFKAYYAIRNLTSPDGKPTGAVYGFLRMLLRLIQDQGVKRLAVIFDTGKPTFRAEMFPAYKANREAPPPDFGDQMEMIDRLLAALKIRAYELDGFEADDLIATIAKTRARAGLPTVIVSADKDLFQLVEPQTGFLRFGAKDLEKFDAAAVEAKLGVKPEQIPDWLALVGDSSDNIPGVPTIGEKGAAKLLQEFGSLEALIERRAELKNERTRKALEENFEQARLSRKLATTADDVPFKWSAEECGLPENLWNAEAVEMLTRLGFESILKERGIAPAAAEPAKAPAGAPKAEEKYELIYEAERLGEWLGAAEASPWLALDTETTGVDAMQADLVGISLACAAGKAIYIPAGHRIGARVGDQIPVARLRQILGPYLRGEKGPKLSAHHAKFDWKVLAQAGFDPAPPAFDTMIASFVLDPARTAGHGLKALGAELCGVQMQAITEIIGSGKNQMTPAETTPEDLFDYAARDADVTYRLTEMFAARLAAEPSLKKLFDEIEMPLIPVLFRMEMGGVGVDPAALEALRGVMGKEIDRLTKEIWREAGREFNIASTKQLAELLFDELALPKGKKTKTGYSTDNDVLEAIAGRHPIVQMVLDFRALVKLKSTYADTLPRQVNPKTRRIHTSLHQTIALTGRLSSTEPNLQNIPIRTELGREIRRAFVPDAGHDRLISADYSQIELRILAHFSGDATLRAAYREGKDIHALTAAQVFGVEPGEVTSEMRAQAKVINFGIIYGMSAHGLSQRLQIPRAEAAKFIDAYFKTYPGVRRWIDQTLEDARRDGYVTTLRGRRRYLPEINAKNGQLRANAERIAMNTPIQGTSADMIKLAMIEIDRGLAARAPRTRMTLQVHDELIFSAPEAEVEAASEYVREAMIAAMPLDVPIAVDVSSGKNWAEC